MRKALILFSHGSLLCGAGENLRALANRLRVAAVDDPLRPVGTRYVAVEVGYLNYSKPFFEQAVEACLEAGATTITVAPYFLVPGRFVTSDLPPRISAAAALHPAVRFIIAEAMGDHPLLAEAVLSCAGRARPPAEWRSLLNTAPQFCQSNPQCPLYGSAACPGAQPVGDPTNPT